MSTYQLDRDYWRSASDGKLVEAGLESGNELAIALAERVLEMERLADTEHAKQIDDLESEVEALSEQLGVVNSNMYDLEEDVDDAARILKRIELIVAGQAVVATPTLEEMLPEIIAWLNKYEEE